MRLDMTQISNEIKRDTPSEFQGGTIRVNLDHHVPDIDEEERPKIIAQFERIAGDILNDKISVIRDNTLAELWTYSMVHECGSKPLYDSQKDEWYCPSCD